MNSFILFLFFSYYNGCGLEAVIKKSNGPRAQKNTVIVRAMINDLRDFSAPTVRAGVWFLPEVAQKYTCGQGRGRRTRVTIIGYTRAHARAYNNAYIWNYNAVTSKSALSRIVLRGEDDDDDEIPSCETNPPPSHKSVTPSTFRRI